METHINVTIKEILREGLFLWQINFTFFREQIQDRKTKDPRPILKKPKKKQIAR